MKRQNNAEFKISVRGERGGGGGGRGCVGLKLAMHGIMSQTSDHP